MSHSTISLPALKMRLDGLLEVGRALNASLNIDELLSLIATKSSQLLSADRASIYVVDSPRQMLWTRAQMGEGRIEIPITTGLAGAVATSGKILCVEDAYTDPRFNPEVDRHTGYRTRSVLAGPMFTSEGELIGVLQVINSLKGRFSDSDIAAFDAIAGFAANVLQNGLLYADLRNTFLSVIEVMAASIDAKHRYTAGHTARVALYTAGVAHKMGIPEREIEALRVAAYLHDYGKIGIPDAILQKPEALTPDEYEEMKSHAAKTKQLLSKMHLMKQFVEVPLVASSHHERFDGKGYPQGLRGQEIPLGARIMAVADVFDALTSDRDYRKAMEPMDAIDLMRKQVGSAFDPTVFASFEAYFLEELHQGVLREPEERS